MYREGIPVDVKTGAGGPLGVAGPRGSRWPSEEGRRREKQRTKTLGRLTWPRHAVSAPFPRDPSARAVWVVRRCIGRVVKRLARDERLREHDQDQ